MLKRILLTLVAVLMLAIPAAQAQHVEYQEFLLQNAQAGTGGGVPMPVDQYGTVAIDVTISATATVEFEASAAGGVFTDTGCIASNTLLRTTNVISATATGLFQCNVAGFKSFRANVTANTGTVTVFARATTASFQ